MNKKVLITVAAVVVVGVTAFAATNTGLFTGSILSVDRSSSSVECIDVSTLDFNNLQIADDFTLTSEVVSEVSSEVSSQVPSIVVSEVTTEITTEVPSVVSSEVSSEVTSEVSSTVALDTACFTLEELVELYKNILLQLRGDITDLTTKLRYFSAEYTKALNRLNAEKAKTAKPARIAPAAKSVPSEK